MKLFWKKLFCVSLVLVLTLSLTIPTMAGYAEPEETGVPYEITVNGISFMSNVAQNYNTWSYVPAEKSVNNTLYLKGYNGGPIKAEGHLHIRCTDGSVSTVQGAAGEPAVNVTGYLFIQASNGTLTFQGGDSDSADGIGGAGVCGGELVSISSQAGQGSLIIKGGNGATGGNGIIGTADVTIMADCIVQSGGSNSAGITYATSCIFYTGDILVEGYPVVQSTGNTDNVIFQCYNATYVQNENYIKVTPDTYTTILNGNGGTLNGDTTVTDTRVYNHGYIYFGNYAFTQEGYVLVGWSKSQACVGTPEYRPDEYYSPYENVTLYAQWVQVGAHDVLLYSHYGTFSDGFRYQKMSGDTVALPTEQTYDYGDYKLIAWRDVSGWETESNAVYLGTAYLPGETIATDSESAMTLYAFEASDAARGIIYHPNGGTIKRGGTVLLQGYWGTLIDESYLIAPEEGLELAGWSDSPEGEVKYLPGASISVEGICDLYAVWQPEGTQIKLTTPTDLAWGKKFSYLDGSEYEEIPGVVSWKTGGVGQTYRLIIYRQESDEDVKICEIFGVNYAVGYHSDDVAFLCDLCKEDTNHGNVSGNYFFTVQSIGDGEKYIDSEIATSPVWHYDAPDEQLSTAIDLEWNGSQAMWDMEDTTNVYEYEVEFFFAQSKDEEPKRVLATAGWDLLDHDGCILQSYIIEQYGSGLYYFRVRAISKDITKYRSSVWSELSPAYDLMEVTDQINSELDEIMDTASGDTKSETIQAVQAMDTEKLATAMAADNDGTGASSKIAELEEKIGTTAAVDVTNAPEEFQSLAREISAVGAGLNATEENQKVILKIDAPAETHVLAAQYSNSVEFSMQLVDDAGDEVGTEGRQLAVPVKITLPIPNSINPMSMVVLHHHSDGATEEIIPYIFEKNDTWYATFVVTSFSDFEFVNPAVTTLENGIQVSTKVQGENISSVLCAAYDADGKQLGIGTMAQGENGLWSVEITCDPAEVDHVKVFAMDSQNCPVAAEKTITVSVSGAE